MKIDKRKIAIFAGVYLLTIIFSNFLYALTLNPGFDNLISVVINLGQPTLAWSSTTSVSAGITYYFGLVLLNIYFAVLSYFLVFKKNFSIKWWAAAFVVLNLLIVFVLRLKDYLYSGV